jgi:hypothetical protein
LPRRELAFSLPPDGDRADGATLLEHWHRHGAAHVGGSGDLPKLVIGIGIDVVDLSHILGCDGTGRGASPPRGKRWLRRVYFSR